MNQAHKHGYNSVADLTRALKYNSTEKLYRLKRSNDNKPSFTIIEDLANLFDSVDLEYLITGNPRSYETLKNLHNAEEVPSDYKTKVELLKSLLGSDDIEAMNNKIDSILKNQIEILNRLDKANL